MANDFLESRYDFVAALAEQNSMNTGESLYDKKGTISRAALMGISKDKIAEVLDKNRIFKQHLNLLEDSSTVTDPIEKARLLEFKDFYETLKNMEDPDQKVSLRSELSSVLNDKYDDIDSALYEVDNDGTPREIFDALLENEKWKEDARDYLTRDYVDLPTKRQRERWSDFKKIVDMINDLRYF